MGGGLMQLVAYGAQDVYLTGNPQITFWKVTYRRHTNFAMESIEQTFNGQADFGRRVQCTISRNGDLAYRTYLQVTLPEVGQDGCCGEDKCVYARWLDYPGVQLISMVEVEIGGQRIDRQYGDWMHIWNQLTLTAEQESGYNKMVGQTTQLTYLTHPEFADVDSACAGGDVPAQVCAPRNALPETTLYVPLQFWFCRNPGLALPLIALQYHEVRVNLELRPSDEVLFAVTKLEGDTTDPYQSVKDTVAYQKSLVAASLYVDYIFLDTDERRRMAQNPHEYLIEQLQFTGDESVGSSSNKVKLNFNHPCKELVWVVQPDSNVDYCASFLSGTNLNAALGAQPFNYTDGLDALPNAMMAFGGPNTMTVGASAATNSFVNPDTGLFQDSGANSGVVGTAQWGDAAAAGASCSAMDVHSRRILQVIRVYQMPAHSFLAKLLSASTAGDRTRLSLPNFNLTGKTASRSAKEHISTSFSHTNTTRVPLIQELMFTRLLSDPRNTSQAAHAICRASITLPFSSSSPPMPLAETTRPRSAFTRLTTMCFAS